MGTSPRVGRALSALRDRRHGGGVRRGGGRLRRDGFAGRGGRCGRPSALLRATTPRPTSPRCGGATAASPSALRLRVVVANLLALRSVAVEFGPAELIDSIAVRPLAFYLGPQLFGNVIAGWIFAKLVSDVAFYACAILSYERFRGCWRTANRTGQARGGWSMNPRRRSQLRDDLRSVRTAGPSWWRPTAPRCSSSNPTWWPGGCVSFRTRCQISACTTR